MAKSPSTVKLHLRAYDFRSTKFIKVSAFHPDTHWKSYFFDATLCHKDFHLSTAQHSFHLCHYASHLKFFTKCFSPSYMCFCPWGGFMVKKMVVLSRMHPLPKLLHVLPGLPCQAVDCNLGAKLAKHVLMASDSVCASCDCLCILQGLLFHLSDCGRQDCQPMLF